jgi:hypothetical protein
MAVLVLILTLLLARPSHAQAITPGPAPPTAAGWFVQVGLEPHLVLSLGYVQATRAGGDGARLGVGAGVKVSPYLIGDGVGRLNLILAGRLRPDQPWGVSGAGQLYLARGRNRAATSHGLGMELRIAPGYHGDRWTAAADLGWQGTLLTHIRHSRPAKEAFEGRYADGAGPADGPVDGWYGSTAHRLRIGLVTERSVSHGVRVRAAIGSLFSLQRQGILLGFAHGQVPAYLDASIRMSP